MDSLKPEFTWFHFDFHACREKERIRIARMNEPVEITFRDGMRIRRRPPREEPVDPTPEEVEEAETDMDVSPPPAAEARAFVVDSPEFPSPPAGLQNIVPGNYEVLNHGPSAAAAANAEPNETDYDVLNKPRAKKNPGAAAAAAAEPAETEYDTLQHPKNRDDELPLGQDPAYELVPQHAPVQAEPAYDTTHFVQAGEGPPDRNYAMVNLAQKSPIV